MKELFFNEIKYSRAQEDLRQIIEQANEFINLWRSLDVLPEITTEDYRELLSEGLPYLERMYAGALAAELSGSKIARMLIKDHSLPHYQVEQFRKIERSRGVALERIASPEHVIIEKGRAKPAPGAMDAIKSKCTAYDTPENVKKAKLLESFCRSYNEIVDSIANPLWLIGPGNLFQPDEKGRIDFNRGTFKYGR